MLLIDGPDGTPFKRLRPRVVRSGQSLRKGSLRGHSKLWITYRAPDLRAFAGEGRIAERLLVLEPLEGLSLRDFEPDVSERQVGRIERGEIKRPRQKTLEQLARKLGVQTDEIEGY